MLSLSQTSKSLALALVCFGLSGCMRSCGSGRASLSPEEVVQAYLDVAFNMKDVGQRQELLELTTGPLNEAIAAASEESIREAYVDPKYELQRYTVLERRDRTPRETEISFEIVFKNLAQEGPDDHLKPEEIPTVTVENTVSVIRVKKMWLISDVLNKKSSFVFPSTQEIKAKPATE